MLQEIIVKNKAQLSKLISEQTDLGIFQIKKIIKKRNVKINNSRVGDDVLVNSGDVVYIYIKDREKNTIDIAYSDKNILVAVKPQGIEVQGEDSFEYKVNESLDDLSASAVHRLDRNTMGLVVFALNKNSEEELLKAFKERELDKTYSCIVTGEPQKGIVIEKAFLFKDAKKSMAYIYPDARKGSVGIETHYKVIKRQNELSLLEVKLITGKTHQIRAHLAYLKLPILGDGKYGSNQVNKRYKLNKQLLACSSLTFHFEKKSILHYLDNKTIKYDVNLFDYIQE